MTAPAGGQTSAAPSGWPDPAVSRRRLALALLGYVATVTLVMTLVPFRFALPREFPVHGLTGLWDLVTNVVLFVPLGFLYRLARSERVGRAETVVAGLLLSVLIETVQVFEPERLASAVDVLANGAGAWVGAWGHDRARATLGHGRGLATVLALDLPLMGIVYLLIPLLWVNAATADIPPSGVWRTALLGIVGGTVLAGIHRHYLEPSGSARIPQVIAAGAAWFLVAAVPGMVARPVFMLGATAIVAATILVQLLVPGRPSADRRFEGRVLRRVLPLYLAYLVLVTLWPPAEAPVAWSLELGLPRSVSRASTVAILRLIEYVAAFTVLGYLLAELRGRREVPYADGVRRILLWGGSAALVLEALRGFHPLHGASVAGPILAVGAAVHGGLVYHLLRDHVRRLRLARSP